MLEKSTTRNAHRSGDKGHAAILTVSMVESPPWTLSPADAYEAINQPIYVVVEDIESDKAFLLTMIRAFAHNGLRRAFEKGWCKVVHGGGDRLPKCVEHLVAGLGKGPRNVLILSDSDCLAPGHTTPKMESMRECSSSHDVRLQILSKREIENYIPLEALQDGTHPDKAPTLRAFQRLNSVQRAHYDMKKGFERTKGGEVVVPPLQHALFLERVDGYDLLSLCGGFGEKVWRLFEGPGEVVNKTTIRATCPDDPGEIERILDAIERLL
jgi:hypothetical protein